MWKVESPSEIWCLNVGMLSVFAMAGKGNDAFAGVLHDSLSGAGEEERERTKEKEEKRML